MPERTASYAELYRLRAAAFDQRGDASARSRCVDPITLPPDETVGNARRIMEQQHISGLRASERFEAIVRYGEYTSVWGVMRSDAVRNTRLHGSYRSSDFVFLAELAVQGRFAFTPEYLFNLREHAGQYTGNDWSPQVQALIAEHESYREDRTELLLALLTFELWAEQWNVQ